MSIDSKRFKDFLKRQGIFDEVDATEIKKSKVGAGTLEIHRIGKDVEDDAVTRMTLEVKIVGITRKDVDVIPEALANALVSLKKEGTLPQSAEFEMHGHAESITERAEKERTGPANFQSRTVTKMKEH